MNSQNQVEDFGSNDDWDPDFEGGPVFSNGNIVAYPDQDKNGNWYLTVKTPTGLKFNLFANNGAHSGLEQDFNSLVEAYNQK